MNTIQSREHPGATLRRMIDGGESVLAPGVVDAYWAMLAEHRGYPAVFVTGSGVSNTFGFPDIGLTTFTEMCDRMRTICQATSVPVIADGDTGFGNEFNVFRTVTEYERAGVAAVVLEDQDPAVKRAGYLPGKRVIATDAMVRKLRVAVEARGDSDMIIVGRTDAVSVTGIDDVIERCNAFVEAGVDMINVDSPESLDQLERIAKEVPAPLGHITHQVAGTKVVDVAVPTLREMGYTVVGFPDLIMRVAAKAAWDALDHLHEEPRLGSLEPRMTTMRERWEIVNVDTYDAFLARAMGDEAEGIRLGV